ncbi:hypothetical protein L1887_39021 [Cichorium endivia]|nr:hypothetical protein L1887_39021 [Cichorium endivia]
MYQPTNKWLLHRIHGPGNTTKPLKLADDITSMIAERSSFGSGPKPISLGFHRIPVLKLIQMEQSISSLAFKGSIIEAITEAKRQKKLFLVYISGDNEDSISMNKSTWSDSSVAESLSKYCVLLISWKEAHMLLNFLHYTHRNLLLV